MEDPFLKEKNKLKDLGFAWAVNCLLLLLLHEILGICWVRVRVSRVYLLQLHSENTVHNLGCLVVSRVTSLDMFSLNICIFFAILNDVIRHMGKKNIVYVVIFVVDSEQV